MPVHAASQAGGWCVGALQTLANKGLSTPDMAQHLLSLQDVPVVEENPNRLVFVSSRAARGGNGSEARPLQRLQVALNNARPGDKIIVQPGEYQPVVMRMSGTPSAPIIIAGQTVGAERAVIDGTGRETRGLIEIRGASHITVSGFRLQNAARDGIFVEGTDEGERDIRILNNDIDTTGNAAIYVGGIVMRYVTKVNEYRLFDILVQGNRMTNTNYPKGVNEAISLGGGVDGFVIRNNYIFDTRQYGIDAKAGAINGSITDNVMHGIERHGIYIDAGSRTVANIDVQRNAVFGVQNGIVLARESGRDPQNPNLDRIRVVDNLVFDSNGFGIMAYRHKDDSGIGKFSNITIAENCVCDVKRDAVRLGGIGDFAQDVRVERNLILSSGGDVWNRIGAEVRENGAFDSALNCPS
ncbi:conserved hypothetical protein [Roseobacter denitrificans OCh 114]|uniref:Right handed beta helix domain-containing protein n=1 Tax=Roseobacter denitrificans (strain ATCC 33942 / OCh 114) TaxID=375451 RepID=Q161N8_ROSDO|nr:conserved hypothetical protein [Roseobacter denitrificans OCh 114]